MTERIIPGPHNTRATELIAERIDWVCECGGTFIATGQIYLTAPTQNGHACSKCGMRAMCVGQAFPQVRHRERLPNEGKLISERVKELAQARRESRYHQLESVLHDDCLKDICQALDERLGRAP